ncbi:YeiH family protein [Novosphingobium sp. BL-52-GroH]|uniref:YeiH family protein n=1 Tax=Novosphingobium sp. BL-52-GroH TaxID=3349877 RepID=UPI003851048B
MLFASTFPAETDEAVIDPQERIGAREAHTTAARAGADLYCELYATSEGSGPGRYVPGLLVGALSSCAAAFIAASISMPITLTALAVGLSLNFLERDRRLAPGLEFASRSLLRWAVLLLGARVTLADYVQLGIGVVGAILVIAMITLSAGVFLSRRLGYDTPVGLVAGVAVAICGASAALALADTLGRNRVSAGQLSAILVITATFSATAMVSYPLICHALGLGDVATGFVLGASIHDVAQSLGAAYGVSLSSGHVATIVKLTRVALLGPILIGAGWLFSDRDGAANVSPVPWYVVGFFAAAACNSVGLMPGGLALAASDVASALLVCAIAATAIRSPLRHLSRGGWRPVLPIASATVIALGGALFFARMLKL